MRQVVCIQNNWKYFKNSSWSRTIVDLEKNVSLLVYNSYTMALRIDQSQHVVDLLDQLVSEYGKISFQQPHTFLVDYFLTVADSLWQCLEIKFTLRNRGDSKQICRLREITRTTINNDQLFNLVVVEQNQHSITWGPQAFSAYKHWSCGGMTGLTIITVPIVSI